MPNSLQSIEELVDHRRTGGRFISNTSNPKLSYFRPDQPKDKAVIICPGGGYRGVAIDKEGFWVAKELQRKGYHAFVLKYRTPNDVSCKDKSIAPLQDAQQAVKVVRDYFRTGRYQEPISIGIMGFSAGGHLAALTSTLYPFDFVENKASNKLRPDFSILIYPVITMEDPYTHKDSRENLLGKEVPANQIRRFSTHYQVDQRTPPVFLVHASDDRSVPVQNSLLYYEACIQNGVSAEMHFYNGGGHGFGMYNKMIKDNWMNRLFNWLETF